VCREREPALREPRPRRGRPGHPHQLRARDGDHRAGLAFRRGTPMLSLPRNRLQALALLLLPPFFVPAGVSHFTNTPFFVAIVPHYLPAPLALVYMSGVCEI